MYSPVAWSAELDIIGQTALEMCVILEVHGAVLLVVQSVLRSLANM